MKPIASSCCDARTDYRASAPAREPREVASFHLELTEQKSLALFLCLLVVPVLYILRFLDDNTLTSWKWVFGSMGFGRVYLAVATAVAISWPLSSGRARFEVWGRYAVPILPAVLVLSLHGIPELMLDASRYFLQAKYLEIHGAGGFFREWGHAVEAWTDLPAVPFLYGLIFRFFGEERLWIQIANALVLGGAAWLVYNLGRRLWTQEAGTYAGLFLSAIPFLLLQGPLLMVDIHAMFFFLLALYLFHESLCCPGVLRAAAGMLALALMLLTKYSMFLLLPVFPLVWLGNRSRYAAGAWRRGGLVLLGGLLLTTAFLVSKWEVVSLQLELLGGFQRTGLDRWKESHVSTFLFQMHPVLVALALYGGRWALLERDGRLLFTLGLPFTAFVLGIERSRYLLPLFPLLALGAGYGASRFRHAGLGRMTVFSVTGTSVVILMLAYVPFVKGDSSANLRDAAEYLDQLPGSTVTVYALPQERSTGNTTASVALLDLFSHKEIRLAKEYVLPGGEVRYPLSSLRFTWRLGQPEFYVHEGERPGDDPVVVLSDRPARTADPALVDRLAPRTVRRQFLNQSTPFRYQTLVTVLQ